MWLSSSGGMQTLVPLRSRAESMDSASQAPQKCLDVRDLLPVLRPTSKGR